MPCMGVHALKFTLNVNWQVFKFGQFKKTSPKFQLYDSPYDHFNYYRRGNQSILENSIVLHPLT